MWLKHQSPLLPLSFYLCLVWSGPISRMVYLLNVVVGIALGLTASELTFVNL